MHAYTNHTTGEHRGWPKLVDAVLKLRRRRDAKPGRSLPGEVVFDAIRENA